MKISDVQNLIALSRQGVKVLAENVDAQQGAQAFASIAAVEQWVNTMIEQHQQNQTANADENGQGVEVVEVKDEEVFNKSES